MKIILSLFIFIGLGLNVVRGEDELRLSCNEVRVLGFQALQQVLELHSIFIRDRELAYQAAGGTLGVNDRVAIDNDFQALTSEAKRLINSSFTDSFGENYFYWKDGMKFRTVVHPRLGGDEFPMVFEIAPLSIRGLGKIAEKIFPIGVSNDKDHFLVINGVAIPQPKSTDDILSTTHNSDSAIAWANSINLLSSQTHVRAKPITTSAFFTKIDSSKLHDAFEKGDLIINGVEILGDLRGHTVNSVLSAVNNFSNQAGVQARLMINATKDFEFFANDARNISIQVSERLLPYFGGQLKSDNLFIGSLRLLSRKPFEISVGHDSFLGFEGKQKIDFTDQSLDTIQLTTQSSAAAASVQIQSAIEEMRLRLASIGMIVDACPP